MRRRKGWCWAAVVAEERSTGSRLCIFTHQCSRTRAPQGQRSGVPHVQRRLLKRMPGLRPGAVIAVIALRTSARKAVVMSQQNVGHVIHILLTDEDLRTRFTLDPFETIADLHLRGLALTIEDRHVRRSDLQSWCGVRTDVGQAARLALHPPFELARRTAAALQNQTKALCRVAARPQTTTFATRTY